MNITKEYSFSGFPSQEPSFKKRSFFVEVDACSTPTQKVVTTSPNIHQPLGIDTIKSITIYSESSMPLFGLGILYVPFLKLLACLVALTD